ncbi:MAG TPA: ankyrin repeat domain-containing protein [Fusibacter sp.]|nr:ankyrin repeat domain-containing protein [Fusibacter sp.]
MTPLMTAINNNNLEEVNHLIRQGINVNELDANQEAPIVIAAYKGYDLILAALLKAGANVRAVDPGMKATALHAAAYAGRTEAAKLLIQYNIDIDKQGPYNGYTALHDAVWQGHEDLATLLIEAGANLQLKSHAGETALDFAKKRHQIEIATLIQQKISESHMET